MSASMQYTVGIGKPRADMARAGLHARVHHESHRRDCPETATPDASCPKSERVRGSECLPPSMPPILRRSGGVRDVAAKPHRTTQGGEDTRDKCDFFPECVLFFPDSIHVHSCALYSIFNQNICIHTQCICECCICDNFEAFVCIHNRYIRLMLYTCA